MSNEQSQERREHGGRKQAGRQASFAKGRVLANRAVFAREIERPAVVRTDELALAGEANGGTDGDVPALRKARPESEPGERRERAGQREPKNQSGGKRVRRKGQRQSE